MSTLPIAIDIASSLGACQRQNAYGACKIAEDVERYRQIIGITQPDVIVECGTWRGASALLFAEMGVDVITVDVESAMTVVNDRITVLRGRSTDPVVVADVKHRIGSRRAMVSLDSDHSATHVFDEIKVYGQLVSVGCYLVVEDGIVRWMDNHPWQGSPLDAIERALVGNPAWERDIEIEALYPVSMHPAGWWIKVGDETVD